MIPAPPLPDQDPSDLAEKATTKTKYRSSKQFLLASGARLAIGFGVLGVAGLLVWLARNELATSGLNAFLRSKGLPANVTIENLQLDTAQIRDVRIGPQDKPNLIAARTIIKWHVDRKARQVVLEDVRVEGVQLRLTLGDNGKLDFGSLTPFLKPSSGPKRSVLQKLIVSDALLFLDTPLGQGSARVTVSGGEAQGWTGRADITPPPKIIGVSRASGAAFTPIPFGFAIRQIPAKDAATGSTQIGFALRPDGQNLAYEGLEVFGVAGALDGQIIVQNGGTIRLDSRPATIKIAGATANGFDVSGLEVTTNGLFWSQNGAWQTTGWGNGVVSGTLDSAKLSDPATRVGSTRFRFGAARGQSGRIQLDYQADVQNIASAITGRRFVATGRVSALVKDLTQLGKAGFLGSGQISSTGIILPASIRANLSPQTPPAILQALGGVFSGSGAFEYQTTPTKTQLSLAGPLVIASGAGGRAAWTPDGRGAPRLVFVHKPGKPLQMSGIGAGRVSLEVPGLVGLQGLIDGASYGPQGWAVLGRNLSLETLGVTPRLSARLYLDRFDASGLTSGPMQGQGGGQITLASRTQGGGVGNARLNFDLRATPSSVSGTLQGPFEGMGSALGLDGYGARGGTLSLRGMASRQGGGWQIDAQGQLLARALAIETVSLIAPNATITAKGQLNGAGNVAARTVVSVTAQSAQPISTRNQARFGGIAIAGNANLGGTLGALQINGALKGALDKVSVSGTIIETVTNQTDFRGQISPSYARLSGAHTTAFKRLSRADSAANGRVDIVGGQASGPFTAQIGRAGQVAPFWDGRLASTGANLTTTLTLSAQRVMAASTALTQVRLSAPITATTNGASYTASGDVDFTARTLNTGDTQLNGVMASGPLTVAGNADQQTRILAGQCLDFAAQSGSFPGEASVQGVSGKLCPDASGQLAILGTASPRLFATTRLAPLTIQIGGTSGDQRINIGEVNGTIVTQTNGNLDLKMLATQFGLSFKMPDGTTAEIKANEAALNILPGPDGVGLTGVLGRVSSLGLPVLMSGGATANIVAGSRGLAGTFAFDDIILKDIEKSPRFGELRLVGGGTLEGNQVSITSAILEPASEIEMARVILSHDIATGSGNLDLTARDVLFSPQPLGTRPGLDIVTLIPPLRGVVLDMVGVANASANMAWSRTLPIVSRANVETKGLDFGTVLGPVSGFAGDINLDDILLVRTAGRQTIKIGLFDPGLPIADGTVTFALPGNNSLRLEGATWPFAEGTLSVRLATWAFRDGDQNFSIDVENVDLAKLLRLTDVPNLEIDGKVSGVFPIEVRDGSVEIVGGRLRAREGGGVIRYTGPAPSAPPPPPGFFGRLRQRFFGKPPPAGADLAIEALRALEYKILEITVDGRITGELQMGVILEGANQQVLSGYPFKFNIKMNVPIGQLLDNINRLNNAGSSPEVLTEIDRVMREDAAQNAPPAPTGPTPVPTVPAPPPPTPAP